MLAKPAVAETVPVSLSGDEVHYDYGLQQIEASGNVKISYKDIKIQCERALIDQTANVILATGKVIVDQERRYFSGRSLFILYSAATRLVRAFKYGRSPMMRLKARSFLTPLMPISKVKLFV